LRLSCPQGGVLSPFLWNLIMDSLLDLLEELKVFNQAFADDSLFGIPGQWGDPMLIRRAEEVLRRIFQWGDQNRTLFNQSKIKVMYFDRNRRRADQAEAERVITLCGREFEFSMGKRYLGIWMVPRLLWDQHVHQSIGKVRKLIMACRLVFKKRWGQNTRILRLLFQFVFLSQLLYGSLARAEICDHGRLVSEKQKVIRSFCFLMTRSFP